VQYIQPHHAAGRLGQAELLVIDEAAAIPLTLVKAMLGPYLVFLCSTGEGVQRACLGSWVCAGLWVCGLRVKVCEAVLQQIGPGVERTLEGAPPALLALNAAPSLHTLDTPHSPSEWL
jgi:hypothetical protein